MLSDDDNDNDDDNHDGDDNDGEDNDGDGEDNATTLILYQSFTLVDAYSVDSINQTAMDIGLIQC